MERPRCPGGCGKYASTATYDGYTQVLRCEPCTHEQVAVAEQDAENRLYRTGAYAMYAGVR